MASAEPNHLISEKSPYLLQHAYNPVDWYPWGPEAFEKSRRENKPVFLSIGYSTCHWCHVMERESFSNPKIAEILNRHFVSIKVDREERPDVDKIYMSAVQAMSGAGGWPLNAWLTPELKPFYGGTYFPPEERWGRMGFDQTLLRIVELWEKEREKLTASGNQLAQFLEKSLSAPSGVGAPAQASVLDEAFEDFAKAYDARRGGFGGAPKFPMPVNLNFLLRYGSRSKNAKALEMVKKTLSEMAKGGIYDHLGGGFHRYSTDDKWHLPHFEKMLYDNAQIALNYLEAYQASKEKDFMRVARETLDYVLREMTHPEGGFYSAEDADSFEKVGDPEKREGAFYVWSKKEILELLGAEAGEKFCAHYGVKEEGNVEHDPHNEFTGKNILYTPALPVLSKAEGSGVEGLKESRKKLFEARAKRPRPHLDDKILVSWNGLMLSALAKGAQVLEEEKYLKAAQKAAGFIQSRLYDAKEKRLYRRWREGERAVNGTADDYAFLIQGLLDLYEADFDIRWLQWALELQETLNKLFYDAKNGGFFMTAVGHDPNLMARVKEDYDNVEPSASSVAALNLLRLSQFAHREEWREVAERTLTLFAETMRRSPRGVPQMLSAFGYSLAKAQQIILAGSPESPELREMLRAVHARFIPNKILMVLDGGNDQEAMAKILPAVKNMKPIKGKPTAYVCINYTCNLPTSDLSVFSQILDGKDLGL